MKVKHGLICSKVALPTSKSFSNRVLILASQTAKPIKIHGLSASQDVIEMQNALEQMGIELCRHGDMTIVKNSFPECERVSQEVINIGVGEGGTTARFICALLAKGENCYKVSADGHMIGRPMEDLFSTLIDLGVQIERLSEKSFPVLIRGPLKESPSLIIRAHKSSQFLSALSLVTLESKVQPEDEKHMVSKPYWMLTKYIRDLFLSKEKNEFSIPVDFSSLSYPAVYAALNQKIHVENCFEPDPLQADSQLLNIFKKIGVTYEFQKEGLYINRLTNEIEGFEWDCINCPDLVPALVFFASYCGGKTKLKSLSSLRFKESDRIDELCKLLRQFEISHHYDEQNDTLEIQSGKIKKQPVVIETAKDHRMVMTAALFLKHNAGGELKNTECVKKSFPHFFKFL